MTPDAPRVALYDPETGSVAPLPRPLVERLFSEDAKFARFYDKWDTRQGGKGRMILFGTERVKAILRGDPQPFPQRRLER